MAVYDYSANHQNPENVKCIRVVVSVGSDIHQRYFYGGEHDAAARWEANQLKKREVRNRKLARTRSAIRNNGFDCTKTALSGLRINVAEKKGRAGQKYYRCIIALSVMSVVTDEKAASSSIVTCVSLQKKWYEMCKSLSYHKGFSSVPKAWLDGCPTVADFNKTIKGYVERNPLIDLGFSTLPKSKYPSARSTVMKGY